MDQTVQKLEIWKKKIQKNKEKLRALLPKKHQHLKTHHDPQDTQELVPQYLTRSIMLQENLEKRGKNVDHDHEHEDLDLDFHKVSITELYARFNTSEKGLNESAVHGARSKYGRNVVVAKKPSFILKVLRWVFGGFGWLLCVAAIASILSWQPFGEPDPQVVNLGIGIFLILVVILNASFNAYQEWTSSRVMASIYRMLPAVALIMRDGTEKEIPVSDIVVGDIVFLKTGNRVPADVRLIKSDQLKTDQSLITGKGN